MIKRAQKFYKLFGIFSIIIGAVLLIGSFPRITGFNIFEAVGFDKGIGGFLGVLLMIFGVWIIMISKSYRKYYDDAARMVYEKLIEKKGEGHHTTNIGILEKVVSNAFGPVSCEDVKEIIKNEAESGGLNISHGTSVSLTGDKKKVNNVLSRYGNQMPPEVKKRLEDLRDKGYTEGHKG